jgi:hypothetical protein
MVAGSISKAWQKEELAIEQDHRRAGGGDDRQGETIRLVGRSGKSSHIMAPGPEARGAKAIPGIDIGKSEKGSRAAIRRTLAPTGSSTKAGPP